VRVRARGRKLWAISFEERLVAGPILSPPDAQGTLENCPCADRIGNDGRVKLRAFTAGYDGTAGDDPLQRIAVPEVYIVEIKEERVEPERRVADVKTRLTAVPIDFLRPRRCRLRWFFERTIILRAAHQVVRVRRIN